MVIGFEAVEYSGREGENVIQVAVVLVSGILSREVEVTITSADDTARGTCDH